MTTLDTDSASRVVIVGGGFGGLAAAKALRKADARVGLIDRQNPHVSQPLLYQVATSVLSPAQIASPPRSYRCGSSSRGARGPGVDLQRHELSESLPKEQARSMHTRFHDRDIESQHVGDLAIRSPFDVAQYQRGPICRGQLVDRRAQRRP